MSPKSRLVIAATSTSIVLYVLCGAWLGRVLGDTTYGQLAVFNEVVHLVIDDYVEPVNLDRAMSNADQGITEALDGDSAYLDADEFKTFEQPLREGDADVGLVLTRRFSFLAVVAPVPGSPAERAGIKPGDILKTVDAHHTRTIAAPIGQRMLRGAPGSVVKLRVLRAGTDPLDFSLVRERFQSAPATGRVLEDGTGYVRVADFTSRTGDEVRGEVEGLRRGGAKSLVLDLRGVASGAGADAVRVAEVFLKGGVVAQLRSRKGGAEQTLSADPGRSVWDRPVAVLVNFGTAGPAEIVAGALLDAGHPLVGEHTFGRAAEQQVFPMPEGGLLLTVSKYATPRGSIIHGKGIEPSVVVEVQAEDGKKDTVLEKALEVLRAPAKAA